ncbi:MAG TPA: N-acetylmuramoyl-L-alanine amidase [Bacteroidales bacterium]|nr:N-acetylmuramoyl-L-alanine amidase [Bacteroidales bacterium]
MRTDIKNGKHRTINIISFNILFILISTLSLQAITGENPEPKNDGNWIIVIDPGHGGRDPGALGKNSREKDINLAIALKTGKYIEENIKNARVIYTRTDDSTVDLYERPAIAIRNKADLFISIHANWAKYSSISGAETYIMGLTRDKDNLEVAMKENEVILLEDDYSTRYEGFDPKSPESYIIFTLTQNLYKKQSTDLAVKIQDQFTQRVKRKDRGVRQAGFLVLYRTSMPSVLIETGFLTNPEEERFLLSAQGQDYMASAIFRACRDYLNEIDGKSSSSVFHEEPAVDNNLIQSTEQDIRFMVQIASSRVRTEVNPGNFRGIKEITEIKADDRYKYATGSFAEYKDAVAYRKNIEKVYPDAFVIAVKANKILPLRETLNELKRNKNLKTQ